MTAIVLALVGVVILVLWRNGTLQRLITPAEDRRSDIANRGAARDVVDTMPFAGGGVSAGGSRPSASLSIPTNGFTASGSQLATMPLFQSIPAAVSSPRSSPIRDAHDRLTKAVTSLPNAFQTEPARASQIRDAHDRLTDARRAMANMGGGGGRALIAP